MALHPGGWHVDLLLAISVNDLLATRKVIGMTAPASNHFCSICDLFGVKEMHCMDFENWKHCNVEELWQKAYKWQDAPSQAVRDKITEKYGICWSKLWRLPYWDPTRMAVVDAMHCILEGIVHYHC